MGARAITQEFYDALVDGYARHPGSGRAAARAAGCDPRTARRGWSVGWPKNGFRPIAEVLAERQAAARAVVSQREQDARTADRDAAQELATTARTDAVKETATDGQIARTAKHNALAALATGANLLQRGFKISKDLTSDELGKLTVMQRIKALKIIAEFNKEASVAADMAVKLERLILGEPGEISEERHVHEFVQPKDMEATITRAQKALARAREHGVIDTTAVEPTGTDG